MAVLKMVSEILKSKGAIGKRNAIKLQELVKLTGLVERELYAQISKERSADRKRICASRSDGSMGYYIAENDSESYDYYNGVVRECKKRLMSVSCFKPTGLEGQLSLDEYTASDPDDPVSGEILSADDIAHRAGELRNMLIKHENAI